MSDQLRSEDEEEIAARWRALPAPLKVVDGQLNIYLASEDGELGFRAQVMHPSDGHEIPAKAWAETFARGPEDVAYLLDALATERNKRREAERERDEERVHRQEVERELGAARKHVEAALSGDAGRGALLPTGEPGTEAIKVAGGWAIADGRDRVYVMRDGHCVEGTAGIDGDGRGFVFVGPVADRPKPDECYLDRRNCIVAAVCAIDKVRQWAVFAALDGDDAAHAMAWRENLITTWQLIAAVSTDSLLHAYQRAWAAWAAAETAP